MTLAISRFKEIKRNATFIVALEKAIVEDNHPWLNCVISSGKLLGKGIVQPKGCKKSYVIEVIYSPLDYCVGHRVEKIQVLKPNISFNPKIHMYGNCSLCLYYPGDNPLIRPLSLNTLLPWVCEWLVKYEFWERFNVWFGNEVKH